MREGWASKSFEECLERVRYPSKIQRQRFQSTGKFPIVSQESDFVNGYWDNEGDVLRVDRPLVVFGDHTQVLKYIDFDFVLGADGVKLLKPQPFLYPRFFYYFLVAHPIKGIGYARHYRFLKELNVSYPSLPEQQRIAAILDESFAGLATAIANAEKNLQNVRELFDSVSRSLLQTSNPSWQRMSLESLLNRGWIVGHLDGNHGSEYPRKEEFISSGVPYISANCLKNGKVEMSLAKYLSPQRAASLRKGIAQNNDVLFAHNATVGPVAILYTDEQKVILSTSLTYYRCNPDFIVPEYLAHYMRSPGFKVQYETVMRQSTRNQVPITKQREFYHVIPPLDVQRAISEKLDSLEGEVDRVDDIYQHRIACLSELRQSILGRAFSGKQISSPSTAIEEAAE